MAQHIEINLDELDRERSVNTPYKVRRNRAVMTIVHFVLTYPAWSISLFLNFASRTTNIPQPSEQVTIPLQNLRQMVVQEANLYRDCVTHVATHQQTSMDRVVQREEERVEFEQNRVSRLLSSASHSSQTCQLATINAQRALKTYSNFPRMQCPNPEQLFTILSQGTLQEDASSIFGGFVDHSLATLNKVTDYAQERLAYDYQYFIGVYANVSEFDLPNLELSLPHDIELALDGLFGNFTTQLNITLGRFDLLFNVLDEFNVSVNGLYLNYTVAKHWLDVIVDGVFEGVSLPGLVALNISGLSPPIDLLPSVELPNFDLPDFDALTSDLVQALYRIIQDLLEAVAKQIIELLKELLEVRLDDFLENYDPPTYPSSPGAMSLVDEPPRMQQLADTASRDMNETLDELIGFHETRSSNLRDESTSEDPNNFGGDYEQDDFSFLDLGIPQLVIPLWLVTLIGFMNGQTLWIECITQAIRLYRLKRKYEKKGAPDLPEIDYIAADDEVKEEASKQNSISTKLQVAQLMLLKNLMNPWVIVGLVVTPMVICVLILWFPHVKANCLHSRRGTFWARNILTPAQVNQANTPGFALHRNSQTQCNRRQRTFCSEKTSMSDAMYRKNKATLFGIEKSLNKSVDYQTVVHNCVHVEQLDALFEINCCGLKGYGLNCTDYDHLQQFHQCPIDESLTPPASFRPVGEIVSEPLCVVPELDLESSRFNCSVLEGLCNNDICSGANKDLIQAMTIEADCSIEIYIVHFALFVATAVYHAIVINIFNALIFNGILHLRWRSLNPNGIKIIARLSHSGEMIKGGDLAERAEKIERMMGEFQTSGWIQIGLGVTLFLLWAISFTLLKKTASLFDAYPE